MELYYWLVIGISFILAISQLIVGVSNDAVNFLNSAVGSKAAPVKVVMLIAGLGVLIGALFSGGMLEIAQTGIFNPQKFGFEEVIMIFLSVMITNVILLDTFNSYGLPTSTTVSLIFELLGGAVVLAIMKIASSAEYTMNNLAEFINTSKVSAIVFSILASVIIGFTFGAIFQYLLRVVFSFKLKKTLKYFGAIWGGICICLISYFLVVKGMKDSSLMNKEILAYINDNIWLLMFGLFLISGSIMQLCYMFFKINMLRIVVLFGTFALATAFAGNDLVNFVGVPVASLQNSVFHFNLIPESGVAAFKNNSQLMFLVLSGIVMVFTLYFSKKAKNVIKTELSLSKQDSGSERFSSTPLSRSVVKMFMGANEVIVKLTPKSVSKFLKKRFKEPKGGKQGKEQGAAFDMLRASVNLMVASALIAFGTSLKLPLSTTYITFMVAMGSSLSDGAWGRDTAVYRITGVFTVITGWFVTAIAAFILSGLVVLILYLASGNLVWQYIVLIGFVVFVLYFMFRSDKTSKRNNASTSQALDYLSINDTTEINKTTALALSSNISALNNAYQKNIKYLDDENLKGMVSLRKDMDAINNQTKILKDNLNETFKIFDEQHIDNFHFYVQAINYLREISRITTNMLDTSFNHTNNKHKPLIDDQINELNSLAISINAFNSDIITQITGEDYSMIEQSIGEQAELVKSIDTLNKRQMKRVKNGTVGTKNTLLYSAILESSKNILLFSTLLLKAQRDFVYLK